MVNRINNLIDGQITSINKPVHKQTETQSGNFASVLAQEKASQDGIKISSHAQKRLDASKVKLSDDDMKRLDGAIQKASEKGSNQALIMLDNMALVVSVKNKVVITAVDDARNREGIFTNIDSVVIA